MTAGDEAWDWHIRQDRRVPDSPQRDALLTDALSARADPTLLDAVATTNVTALLRVARSVKKAHPLLAQALTGLVQTQPGSRAFTHRRLKEEPHVQDISV